MKSRVLTSSIVLLLLPLFSIAQKAYEVVVYRGVVNTQTVRLELADGYLAASKISIKGTKNIIFIPESGSLTEDGRLKFVSEHKHSTAYFIIDNLSENYERLPIVINGIYCDKDKKIKVRFRRI